jgi:menaquinone-dependent protoporphyrinogen oxidase
VAKEIAKVLAECHAVEVHPLGVVRRLDTYDAVVIGSSLRAGRWLGGMTRFLQRFHEDMADKPVALFAIALTARTLEGSRRVLAESLPPLLARYPELKPFSVQAFGGVLDYNRYSLAVRAIMRAAARREGWPTSGFQDYRDWQAIRGWARELATRITRQAASSEVDSR